MEKREKKRWSWPNIVSAILAVCCVVCVATYIPARAATESPETWKQQGATLGQDPASGQTNTQGDKKATGKADVSGGTGDGANENANSAVYGAIGNLTEGGLDVNGDGVADVTVPESDVINVWVTPTVEVLITRISNSSGVSIQTMSAKCLIRNMNEKNKVKVDLMGLDPGDDSNAKQINLTDTITSGTGTENNLKMTVTADAVNTNAFWQSSTGGIGRKAVDDRTALSNLPGGKNWGDGTTRSTSSVTLGTLQELGNENGWDRGIFLYDAACSDEFYTAWKPASETDYSKTIVFRAVYKFTIQKSS